MSELKNYKVRRFTRLIETKAVQASDDDAAVDLALASDDGWVLGSANTCDIEVEED